MNNKITYDLAKQKNIINCLSEMVSIFLCTFLKKYCQYNIFRNFIFLLAIFFKRKDNKSKYFEIGTVRSLGLAVFIYKKIIF